MRRQTRLSQGSWTERWYRALFFTIVSCPIDFNNGDRRFIHGLSRGNARNAGRFARLRDVRYFDSLGLWLSVSINISRQMLSSAAS